LTRKEKRRIKTLEPYTEIVEPIPSIVPDDVLELIPDVSSVEDVVKEVENTNESTETINHESETLETVISEENSVTEQDSPFFIGGDSDE
jgi:hypothetical protein